MNRRDFLKLSISASVFTLLSLNPITALAQQPVEAAAFGKTYRGTRDGNIYVSSNRGKSWKLHSGFGKSYTILGISTGRDGQLHAQLGFKGHSFRITLSKDGKTWRY